MEIGVEELLEGLTPTAGPTIASTKMLEDEGQLAVVRTSLVGSFFGYKRASKS